MVSLAHTTTLSDSKGLQEVQGYAYIGTDPGDVDIVGPWTK